MNKKNIIGLTVSIILLVLAVVFYKGLFKSDNRPGENELGYYFDLNTRKLFVKDGTMRPPVHAPSGADKDGRPAGVRAYVYSKTGGNANDIEIAFLEYEVPGGSMISAPDVIEWISATSVNGSKLRQSALKRCIEKGYTKRVYPRPR